VDHFTQCNLRKNKNVSKACVKHPAGWQDADKAKGNAKVIEDGIALPLSTADDLRKLLELVAFSLARTGTPPSKQSHVQALARLDELWGKH